ncbi:MAG: hypothetical protein R3B70_00280 [Polyangiaceae bacterium]
MDPETPLILPASASPGAELRPEEMRTPDGVTYFRFYMATVALFDAAAMAFGFFLIFAPFASKTATTPPSVANLVSGVIWAFFGGAHLIGILMALFGGRRPWVHTLGLVLMILSLVTCCCTPFGIPVLIAYNTADVKRFYAD